MVKYTKKYYNLFVYLFSIFKRELVKEDYNNLFNYFCELMEKDNPLFNRDRFNSAINKK